MFKVFSKTFTWKFQKRFILKSNSKKKKKTKSLLKILRSIFIKSLCHIHTIAYFHAGTFYFKIQFKTNEKQMMISLFNLIHFSCWDFRTYFSVYLMSSWLNFLINYSVLGDVFSNYFGNITIHHTKYYIPFFESRQIFLWCSRS